MISCTLNSKVETHLGGHGGLKRGPKGKKGKGLFIYIGTESHEGGQEVCIACWESTPEPRSILKNSSAVVNRKHFLSGLELEKERSPMFCPFFF